jgi:hypothetical protein
VSLTYALPLAGLRTFLHPIPNVVSLTTTPNFIFSHYNPQLYLLSLQPPTLSLRQEDNARESCGTRTEKYCTGNAQKQLKTTDPTSRQR